MAQQALTTEFDEVDQNPMLFAIFIPFLIHSLLVIYKSIHTVIRDHTLIGYDVCIPC